MSTTKTITYTINGLTPMLMHCGQTANPLNQFSKAMKRLSGKKGKTDDDLATLADLEWWAGIYLDRPAVIAGDRATAADKSRLVIPAHVLDSCIREGARKSKAGKSACAGTLVEGDGIFTYEPRKKPLADIACDPDFRFEAAVRVGAAKVIRTRPRFDRWSVTFDLCVDLSVVDEDTPRQWLEAAGKLVGIGDWRPGAPRGGSFGRFVVA